MHTDGLPFNADTCCYGHVDIAERESRSRQDQLDRSHSPAHSKSGGRTPYAVLPRVISQRQITSTITVYERILLRLSLCPVWAALLGTGGWQSDPPVVGSGVRDVAQASSSQRFKLVQSSATSVACQGDLSVR